MLVKLLVKWMLELLLELVLTRVEVSAVMQRPHMRLLLHQELLVLQPLVLLSVSVDSSGSSILAHVWPAIAHTKRGINRRETLLLKLEERRFAVLDRHVQGRVLLHPTRIKR
jgi:hypothetical protein